MDNVTHALAGLLMADATIALVERDTGRPASRALRRSAVLLGVFAAEAPDLDLLYSGPVLGMGKLGYLLHHRGHTHTLVGALLLALLAWGAVQWWARRRAADGSVREAAWPLMALALAGTLSHIALDWTNSYGVHPWWPFDGRWVYGDAVFIVEPWLWVVAIPALLAGPRSRGGRWVLAALLLVIVAAAWAFPLVGREVAVVLAAVAVAWWWGARRLGGTGRLVVATALWVLVDGAGVVSSTRARETVRGAIAAGSPDERLHDVALTTAPADPRCFDALVVTRDGADYRVSTATVAPFPSLRSAAACAALGLDARRGAGVATFATRFAASTRADGDGVAWGREWRAPLNELRELAATHCDVAAALRFMRVPVWGREPDGRVLLSDMRYGLGGGGFADLELPARPARCGGGVPGWTPPRRALLDAG